LGEASSSAQQRASETQQRETTLNQEVNRLKNKVDELEHVIRQRDQTIHDKDFNINERDKAINNLNLKLEDMKELKSLNDKYAQEVNDAEQARIDLQNKFETCLDDHQDQLKQEHDERQKLIREKNDISNQLREAETLITKLRKEIDELKDTVDQRDQTIHDLENRLLILNEIKKQRDQLIRNLKEFEESRDKLHRDIQQLKTEFEELRRQDQEHFSQIHDEKNKVEETLKSRETRITELETQIYEINTTVHKLRQDIDSSEAECNRLKDVETHLSKAKEVHEEYVQDRAHLRQELTKASDFMVDLEEKCHKANATSVTLLNKVKESEKEVDILKDYIYELKSRVAIYIPVREDPIDKKLAEYINNYPDRSKLKIMFMRESSGIYQFGSRKIYVRVEKDRIIIRVGGGYLTIDEFLDIYTPIELEKVDRKGTSKRVIEKMAIQRTLAGRELREESPIRSSPGKIARKKSPKKSPKKEL
jgi:chromosome segregation ATPase